MATIPKYLFFGDSATANEILKSEDAYAAKRLSYQIGGFDMNRWRSDQFDICYDEIKEKFIRNPALLTKLKTTALKILVEATNRLWGTGVSLQDTNVLNTDKWSYWLDE